MSLFAAITLLSTIVVPTSTAGAARSHAASPAIAALPQVQHFEQLRFRGTAALARSAQVSSAAAASAGFDVGRQHRGYRAIDVHPAASLRSAAFVAPLSIPTGLTRPVSSAAPDFGVGFFGFPGLSHFDQRTAGSGAYAGTQYSLEPPDQGLCVGNGYVMEPINDAVAVFNTLGTRLTAATPLSQFFGLNPEVNRVTKRFGPFATDPRCYFDRDTQRWFLTEAEIDTDPLTGVDANHSSLLVAVSQTADPTGVYNLYTLDTTDAGKAGCPCFGDQPLLGADANGVYLSTNEYPITGPGFYGAQVYAFSKTGIATGRGSTVVQLDAGQLPAPVAGTDSWYSIQPAEAPDTSAAARTLNGTEYFLSALDFFSKGDSRIAVWALTNTASLANAAPNLGFQYVIIGTTVYAPPPPATQKAGLTPLGTSLHEPLELINSNDDRMQQVVYAAGRLWSGLNTAFRSGSAITVAAAFFAVEPGFSSAGQLNAHVVQQGYVAVAGQNIMFPSIGVNRNGGAVMTATLTGPQYYPTAVYVKQDGSIHIAGAGTTADDGFTGYVAFGGNGVSRWGDYSAAVADPANGSIWFGAEYVPGGIRTVNANWGTYIGHVQL